MLALALSSLVVASEVAAVERILFASDRDGDYDVYVMDTDGANVVQLTNDPGNDGLGSVSPDGRRIAFYSDRSGNYEIYVMDVDGANVARLTDDTSRNSYLPEWSPDGARIALHRRQNPVLLWDTDVWIMNADGGNLLRLTNYTAGNEMATMPFWSADGSRIGFCHGKNVWPYAGELRTMLPDGTNNTLLTVGGAHSHTGDGDWSPDNARIAFRYRSSSPGDFHIWVMDADGSNWVQLTFDNPTSDGAPSWSPDNARIAFHSNRDGNFEICSMHSDGSDVVQLTDNGSTDTDPVWFTMPSSADVSAPDTTTTYAEDLTVPFGISDVTDQSVVSAEVDLAYDSDLLIAWSVGTSGTLSAGWAVESNIIPGVGTSMDTLRIAMATDEDAVTTDGTLLEVQFTVADIRHPASTP